MTIHLHTLPNGLRAVAIHKPRSDSACVSVYLRAGSLHETPRLNGIGHVIEHMVFKGSQTRDARQINLDAERLGAEVDAYTDKDHTAFHLRGLAEHGLRFVPLLADLLLRPTFPTEELERERQVLLHEYADDADDPVSTTFKLFDTLCFGRHPLAQPVIGTRANLKRFRREDLLQHTSASYTACNTVVVAAGDMDPEAMLRSIEQAFRAMPAGELASVPPAAFAGGTRSKRLAGGGQVQAMLGWPIPAISHDLRSEATSRLAAAVFGEGMSSPLMQEVRERQALAYYVACSADLLEQAGLFVVEASTAPEQLPAFVGSLRPLLMRHAQHIDADELQRARNQLRVRAVRQAESLPRVMEDVAMDLFWRGRVLERAQREQALADVSADEVRVRFEGIVAASMAMALAGPVTRSLTEKASERLNDAATTTPALH